MGFVLSVLIFNITFKGLTVNKFGSFSAPYYIAYTYYLYENT